MRSVNPAGNEQICFGMIPEKKGSALLHFPPFGVIE